MRLTDVGVLDIIAATAFLGGWVLVETLFSLL